MIQYDVRELDTMKKPCRYAYTSGGYGELFCPQGRVNPQLCPNCPYGKELKVWCDACTGKHIRYSVAIAKRLRSIGHKVVLTTRKHPDTLALANLLGENFIVVGDYNAVSPQSKLKESVNRESVFLEMFKRDVPDVALAHGSVELCRVAFGLKVPIVLTHDTPHAEAVNKLTVPLTNVLLVSKAIHYSNPSPENVVQFDGVDEVAWIQNFKSQAKYDYEKPLIVVRQLEAKASYAEAKTDLTEMLALKLCCLGTVVFLPRYGKQPKPGLIVPKSFMDAASLVAQADLMVGAGGTICREAALQGTPTIVIPILPRIQVNDYLSKKGFPIFTVSPSETMQYAKRLLGERRDVKKLLLELENPVDVLESIIEKRSFERK